MAEQRANTSQVISDVNLVAIDYARKHAGELLGTKWYDGENSTEPSEKWSVSESVCLAIRAIMADAFSHETPMKKLVESIRKAGDFPIERAQLIANTEAKLAQSRGNLEAWKRTGVVKSIKWLMSCQHCDRDECDLNHEAGAIPLGQLFPSGVPAPPAHIGCRCSACVAELNEPKRRNPA